AAKDEHARSIEVAGVGDGDAAAGDQAQELDDRPAGLAAGEDNELVGRARRAQGLDVVEERRQVLDDQRAARWQLDGGGAAELSERERDDVAVAGVGGDVIEAVTTL